MTLAHVVDFLTFLFFERNLKPGTIARYKTALTVPLMLQLGIDLLDPDLAVLLRAMSLQRPCAPVNSPSWDLNKVLNYIDQLPTELSQERLLQKTAFLLLLATGYRISELHACVRDPEYCYFLGGSTLMIRPHPNFLAKNECPQDRWDHVAIRPLRMPDGSVSRLCPARSIQDYLLRTNHTQSGGLFTHPVTQKPLSLRQLGALVCKLIRTADPSTKVKIHDVRKYAASCALAETMQISGVVSALRWSSARTFWKYYMAHTAPLSIPAVLPGTLRSTERDSARH